MRPTPTVLALVQTEDCADELRAAAREAGALRLDVLTLADALSGRIEVPPCDVLLFEMRMDQPRDMELLSHLLKAGSVPVVAMLEHGTVADVRLLVRRGVKDVLPRPVTPQELVASLDACAGPPAPQGGGRVVSFLRSGGGMGATTLAVQTALSLLDGGKGKARSVCLLDFDLQFGVAALSLDLGGTVSAMSILEEPQRLDEAYLAQSMQRHESGLDVLAAPPTIVPLDAMPAELAIRVVELARLRYDHVVVDLPHDWTPWSMEVMGRSDALVLVTRANVAEVHRVRRQIAALEEHGLDRVPLHLVANAVESGFGWRRKVKPLEEALGRDYAVCIRRDDQTAQEARDRGVPLRTVAAGSKIEKDLAALIGLLTAESAKDAAAEAAEPARRRIAAAF